MTIATAAPSPTDSLGRKSRILFDTPEAWAAYRRRVWDKIPVRAPEVCWDWKGRRLPTGYALVSWLGRTVYVHRLIHEWLVGPIPDGYQIDHLCRNRSCVNPFHLEAVTPWTNTMRGLSPAVGYSKRISCNNGHPFTIENTAMKPDGSRVCRTCHRETERVRRAARKAVAA